MDDLTRPLARVIYEAHARSRNLKSRWEDIGGSEKEHWYHVSAAAITFWGDYADGVEEDTIG
jgi:hypothetical protein